MDARSTDARVIVARPERPPDWRRQWALLDRRRRLFASVALAVALAGFLLTIILPPRYAATAEVMIDPRRERVVDMQQVLPDLPTDNAAVETEAEVLKSRLLAEKVATRLRLNADPEFNPALRSSAWLRTPAFFDQKTLSTSALQRDALLERVQERLKVARVGMSYVITVSFSSRSPEKAAIIANAFTSAYLQQQLDAKSAAARRATDWLSSRLGSLRTEVTAAERAVERYKAANGLMTLTDSQGGTMNEEEVSNLSTQLASARSEMAEADARLATVKNQTARGGRMDDLGEVLNAPLVQELRKQRDDADKSIADLEGRYGPRHPEMKKALRQRAELDAQIQQEIARVIANLKLQSDVAKGRYDSIRAAVANAKTALAKSNGASVELKELERNLEAERTIYQSFLDRFKQTSVQDGIAQADSRLVSPAKVPLTAQFPNRTVSLLCAGLGSLIAGLLAVSVAEALEDGVYTVDDIERLLGVTCLGAIPTTVLSPIDKVVDDPTSSFTEAVRALRIGLSHTLPGASSLVTVTSALAGEGKTTTCICLGRVIAKAGAPVVVVDCDLRRRTMNRHLATSPRLGLLNVLTGGVQLDDALICERATGLSLLPLGDGEEIEGDIFFSPAMDQILESLGARFKMVILDAGPVLMVAETTPLAARADAVLFIMRWGRTPVAAAQGALKRLLNAGAYVVGAALTQVDPRLSSGSRHGYGADYYPFHREEEARIFRWRRNSPKAPRKS